MTFKLSQRSIDRLSGVHPDWKLHRRHAFAMTQIGRLTDYLETIQVDYAEHVGP